MTIDLTQAELAAIHRVFTSRARSQHSAARGYLSVGAKAHHAAALRAAIQADGIAARIGLALRTADETAEKGA